MVEEQRRKVEEQRQLVEQARQSRQNPIQDIRPAESRAASIRGGVTQSREQERDQARNAQEQLLRELEALKGNQKALSRPGTATAEVAAMRNERDRAMEERNDARTQLDQAS